MQQNVSLDIDTCVGSSYPNAVSGQDTLFSVVKTHFHWSGHIILSCQDTFPLVRTHYSQKEAVQFQSGCGVFLIHSFGRKGLTDSGVAGTTVPSLMYTGKVKCVTDLNWCRVEASERLR
jgi:hypothetical protein